MSATPISPLLVLIVEDLDDTAQSTAELVTLCGHRVQITCCGDEALRAAAEMPDVVLLDIGLPRLDGWEVARRMRDQAKGKQPFIVAVTGYATDDDRWRSADAGVDIHLVKPTDPVQLMNLLNWVQGCLPPRPVAAPPSERI